MNRLMRQSQQERRIAVQLLQARHEKEVIRRNRLAQEKEYEARRLAEFEEALNKEAVSQLFMSVLTSVTIRVGIKKNPCYGLCA